MLASRAVVDWAGGTWDASLNLFRDVAGQLVVTVQVDEWVFVVGPGGFSVSRYRLGAWCVEGSGGGECDVIDADSAEQAWELLRLVREDALLWQCGACDGWIFTSNRPRLGVLGCSTCGGGGVDFRHADRATWER